MSQPLRLQVYVSYNTVHEDELKALEESFNNYNARDASSFQMEVKYSKKCMQDGDSIIEFMDEIAVARFVVLFFSKEYFESPYCLYELISLYEKQQSEERFIVLPIKLGNLGAAINSYTIDNIIDAWQGKGDLTPSTLNKEKGFCQKKLIELLNLDDDEIETKIKEVYSEVIKPWLDKNIADKTTDETVLDIETKVRQSFKTEREEFDKLILDNIKYELGYIKNLEQSWEAYSGDSIKKEAIANRLMEGDYSRALLKIQAWAKAEKRLTSPPTEWRIFFNSIQKIAGWFVLKSVNHDWWINNLLSFTYGAKNHSFVKLCLQKKHFSYSEVVVSKALKKSAQFLLDDQNKLQPQIKEYAIRAGNDFVFDCNPNADLHALLIPIVTDLRKTKPQIDDVKELFDDLLTIASNNTDNFFYLVTEDYLKQLQTQLAPDDSGKTVLKAINEKLKDQLFFIAIGTDSTETAPQVTQNFIQAISLMENILLIDK